MKLSEIQNRAGTWLDECLMAFKEAEARHDPITERRKHFYDGARSAVEEMGGKIVLVPCSLFSDIHKVTF